MPPLPLTNLLHAALPQPSTASRAVVTALVAQNGAVAPTVVIAGSNTGLNWPYGIAF